MNYRISDGRTYAAIGDPCTLSGNTYICLDVSLPNRPKSVRWFKRELLTAVEERPAPPIEMTADMLATFVEDKLELEPTPQLLSEHWQLSVTRDDPQAVEFYQRHYSFNDRNGRKPAKFGNPGHYIALMTLKRDALFLWTKERHRKDGQTGVNCGVFRNESDILSSTLIREAMDIAQKRWPGERLFTFVDAGKVRSKNPGCCFKKAGWRECGKTGTGLLIFEWTRPIQMTVEMPLELLEDVDPKLSLGVDIRVVEKPTVCMDWLKYAPLFITPNNTRVYWCAEVELASASGKAAA